MGGNLLRRGVFLRHPEPSDHSCGTQARPKMKHVVLVSAVLVTLVGCAQPEGGPDSITAEEIAAHVQVLASDAFGGRGPSSPGETLTVEYIAAEFERLGLDPGAGDSWYQTVPLVEITADPEASLVIGGLEGLTCPDDFVTWTTRVVEASSVEDSPLVFVGYGIVAPEYGWNDYAGVDMTGKTALILVNDPGYATQDPELFTGNAMTYYGRWTYKFEEAARQGAAAALVIHQTAPAAYGWETVRSSWTGPQFKLESADGNLSNLAIEGWLTEATNQMVFEKAGLDFEALEEAASVQGFQPVEMNLAVTAAVTNTIRHSESRNVIGVLPGSEAPEEAFVYLAHWDHLGTDPALVEAGEDGIYNGAMDNATGTAALLELAEAFSGLTARPRRSIVFVAVTAEEQGLLGSAYYAANPVIPLSRTVAGLNVDGLNIIGPTREIVVTGYGMSELDGVLERVAVAQGRRVDPNPHPERGGYYRSDHFELAKKGVPMIYPGAGKDHVEYGREWGEAQAERWNAENYHRVTDEYDPAWDLSGAVEDVGLFYAVGAEVAGSDAWPTWNEGTEFRGIRDSSLASGR